jgi:predicted Zn finger-like uncharacterized protein
MNIVCPNCGTSYDIQPAALGPAGRTVRCVRCRDTWHARVDDMVRADALVQAADEIGWDQAMPAGGTARADASAETAVHDVPEIESPPLVYDAVPNQDAIAPDEDKAPASNRTTPRRAKSRRFAFGSGPIKGLSFGMPMAIGAMAAILVALFVWRHDVVRLLPQTATFFQYTGFGVNLRNLRFEDVRVSTEMVNGSKMFVIEGAITPAARKPMEIPRLRFVVQDAHGVDIYAWNAVVEQAVLQPGEKVAFRSRLASPPDGAHSIIVRFFNRRDLVSGSV